MDSGRRMGTSGSQVRCTKLPGSARAAHFGAFNAQHELLAGPALLRDDRAFFEKNAAAMRGVHAGAASGFFLRQRAH